MATAAISVSILALILALAALAKASGSGSEIEEAARQARRGIQNLADEQAGEIERLKRMLAVVAAGGELSEEMIREGRLWKDIDPRAGQALFEAGNLRVLDVRTSMETAGGIIAGAQLIPIEELEARVTEFAKDGQQTLIYCAAGGRSAAACEFLTEQGHVNLLNLSGGFGGWGGPTAKPDSAS